MGYCRRETHNLQRSSLGGLHFGFEADKTLQSGCEASEAETTVHDAGDVGANGQS